MSRAILAIDPGLTESGWCVYQAGRVLASGIWRNEELLDIPLHPAVDGLEDVAIEMTASYGMPVGRDVFETVLWTGRFVQALGHGRRVRLVYRKDVALHLCQSMRAKDPNIRQRLIDLLGPIGTVKAKGPLYGVKGHVWAALAVAVYADQVPASPAGERAA